MTRKKYSLLLVDDELANLQKLRRTFMEQYSVHSAQSAAEALEILGRVAVDAIITDQRMPDMTGLELLETLQKSHPNLVRIVLTGFAEVSDLIAAINTGKVHKYITKPWEPDDLRLVVHDALEKMELIIENERLAAELKLANERLRTENIILRQEVEQQVFSKSIIHGSPEMENILHLLRRVTGTGTTVLIQGETGTGKELIARFIHGESNRRDQIFIPVNCGAIPRELVESEFFGHSRGAFTGATQEKKGFFEMADGGTLFLDEIGEAPPELQVKLLRVIQEGEIMPVGYNQPRKVDVRIIASTNRDLKAEVQANRFRQDLFFRINVFSVTIPPLRERRKDIPPLAEFFLQQFSRKLNRRTGGFSDETRELMLEYSWPGNVRELQNEVERLVLLSEPGRAIGPELLSDHIRQRHRSSPVSDGDLKTAVRELEEEMIRETLTRFGQNRSRTARALGISRQSLLEKLRRMGIND
ncbi:MAG: sigma-54-dependent Fis family transcriptional regulator [Acidobacteria bacterium]|nr:sigma-54-dependent Fis family transcriptional regulator [Acidobacteriota bacterium]